MTILCCRTIRIHGRKAFLGLTPVRRREMPVSSGSSHTVPPWSFENLCRGSSRAHCSTPTRGDMCEVHGRDRLCKLFPAGPGLLAWGLSGSLSCSQQCFMCACSGQCSTESKKGVAQRSPVPPCRGRRAFVIPLLCLFRSDRLCPGCDKATMRAKASV